MQDVIIAIKEKPYYRWSHETNRFEPDYDSSRKFFCFKSKINLKKNIIIVDLNKSEFAIFNHKEIFNVKKESKNKLLIKALNNILKVHKK